MLWYISREIFTSANYIQFQDVTGGWFLQKRGWGWNFLKLICVSKHRHFLFVTNFLLTPKHQPQPHLQYPYLIFWCFKKALKDFLLFLRLRVTRSPLETQFNIKEHKNVVVMLFFPDNCHVFVIKNLCFVCYSRYMFYVLSSYSFFICI